MQITKIEVGKTVPVGEGKNITYLKATLSAELSHNDDAEACKSDLTTQVDQMIANMSGGPLPVAASASRTRRVATTTEEPAKEAPARRTRASAAVKEEPAVDTTEAKPTRRARTAKPAASKPKKSKVTTYDRTNKEHKAEVKKILNANFDGWDKDEEFKKASKATSEELTGTDFIGEDGNVLDSFANAFLDLVEKIEVK